MDRICREWAMIPPRQVRMDTLVTTKRELALDALLADAEEAAEILSEDAAENMALALGAALGGTEPLRNKIVITDEGSGIVGFADWAEQLIAESTGKQGTGILPVVVEPEAPELSMDAADVLVIRLVDTEAEIELGANEVAVAGSLGSLHAQTTTGGLTGVIRDMVYLISFGAGPLMDAFLVAFKIPNFMRRLTAEGAAPERLEDRPGQLGRHTRRVVAHPGSCARRLHALLLCARPAPQRSPSWPLISCFCSPPTRASGRPPAVTATATTISAGRGASQTRASIASKWLRLIRPHPTSAMR